MDWRNYVRSRLPALTTSAERENEIVDELAIQLESIYERERRRGASHDDAVSAAEAEVPDWAALARTLDRDRTGASTTATARHGPQEDS